MKKKLLLLLLFCCLLALLLWGARIARVKVTGNHRYTAEQIEEILFPDRLSRNTALCFLSGALGKRKNIPFVEDYKLVFLSPFSVEVIIYEKSIVGYVSYMSSKMYFDKDGVIVESSSAGLEGIPEILGLSFGHIALYQKLPVENESIFAAILNLTQTLSTNDLPVDCIRYDREMNASLTMGGVCVLLGGAEEINGKISELAGIYPKIRELRGILDLSDYDPADTRRMYSFKKQ